MARNSPAGDTSVPGRSRTEDGNGAHPAGDRTAGPPGVAIESFPKRRRGTVDALRMAGRRSNVHGLVEIDVTAVRHRLATERLSDGDRLSFTAVIVYCLAAAIEDHPAVQAYRDWRGRLVTFDGIDAMVMVETTVDGRLVAVPRVLRGVDSRSLRSIHDEIRSAQATPGGTRDSRWVSVGLSLPGFIRRQVYRLPTLLPRRWARLAGTVGVTSIGMFAEGGGWGITPTNYSLNLTLGGIARKPGYVDGSLEPREYLSVTVTVDHDVIDGAPAARFTDRLVELIEDEHGLDTVQWG